MSPSIPLFNIKGFKSLSFRVSLFLAFINSIFILYFDLPLGLQVFGQYLFVSLLCFSVLNSFSLEKFKPRNISSLIFVVSSIFIIISGFFYFSDGIPLFSADPEFDRIRIYGRFGMLNRCIVFGWQFILIVALVNKSKYKLFLVMLPFLLLILTAFRSFLLDPLFIFFIVKFLSGKKMKPLELIVVGSVMLSLLLALSYIRFGELSSLQYTFETIAYPQLNNIYEVTNYTSLVKVNPLFVDFSSLATAKLSFAEKFTTDLGNNTGQVAAVSLYGYLSGYSFIVSPFIIVVVSYFVTKISYFLYTIEPIAGVFYLWIAVRTCLTQGPIVPIIILGVPLIGFIVVFSLLLAFMRSESNLTIFKK